MVLRVAKNMELQAGYSLRRIVDLLWSVTEAHIVDTITKAEMLRKEGIKIALIDQDIEITLRNFSNSITWREKKNFIVDLLKALFLKKERMEFDLETVPSKAVIKKLTGRLKERYPNMHKTLIEERNIVIANNLKRLMEDAPDRKILVILGAGHVDDVLELVKEQKVRADQPDNSSDIKIWLAG